jgi:predicted PurR-regulated permease PerM
LSAPLAARRLQRLIRFGVVAGALAVLAGVVYVSLLVPILISVFLSYLLLPPLQRLERWRVPRTPAIAAIVLGSVGVLVVAFVQLSPVLYRQLLILIQLLPTALNTVASTWLPAAERYLTEHGLAAPDEAHALLNVGNLTSRVASQLQGGLAGVWKTGSSVVGGILNIVLIPILTFFMLKDHERFSGVLRSLVPPDLLEPVQRLGHRIDLTLRSVLKGQAIVAAILTVLYVVGFTAVGLQSAIAIGVVAGICRIIPYFDVIVGGALSAIVLLSNFTGWGQALSVVLVFVVVQALDGAFITPSVIGERLGLHPVIVILSVLAFGNWLGFWGVLLAIPAAAIVKVLVGAALPYYRQSRAYTEREELPPP